MVNKFRAQVYNELNLRETDELLKIWQENNRDEFREVTFEIIKEILVSRLGYVPPQSVDVQLEDTLNRIENCILSGNLEQALLDCELAIQLDPESAEAYNYRGVIYDRLGDLAKAGSDFRNALQLDSQLGAARDNINSLNQKVEEQILSRVEQCMQNGEYTKALEDCQLAIQLAPDLASAYNYRGIIYEELGKSAEPLLDYQRAVLLNPDLAEAQENLEIAEQELEEEFLQSTSKFHLDQAMAHLNQDQIDMALSECELARQTLPPIAAAHHLLGIILEEAGKLESAVLEYHEATVLNPRFYLARENLGNAIYKLEEEQYKSSIAIDEKEIDSDSPAPLETSVYSDGDSIPGWIYMDQKAFLLSGWAGHRTRPGRTGYDPLDTNFELSHMEGVIARLLLTGKFRTHNPLYLLIMTFLGLFYLLPLLFVALALVEGGWGLIWVSVIYSPYVIAGVALFVNVFLSISVRKPSEAVENGNEFF